MDTYRGTAEGTSLKTIICMLKGHIHKFQKQVLDLLKKRKKKVRILNAFDLFYFGLNKVHIKFGH